MNRQADLNMCLNATLAAFLAVYPDTTMTTILYALEDASADAPTIFKQHEKEAAQ